ncbi:MAG TPA: methyltransferase domain-containing protein [Clostridiaceae bacterium]|nr:methyltransferase domain-containing protein [Clostridiaceae bacterium]
MSNNGKYPDSGDKQYITTAKIKIKENISIFKCPVCGGRMELDSFKSLICLKRHCFDISRNGYVNLLLNAGKSQYDKEMFESRNVICNMGFFDPMIDAVAGIISQNMSGFDSNNIKVLDAGCGEGFHLSGIINALHKEGEINLQGVGIDISKGGIQIAAKKYKEIIWCVADLSRIPFMDKQFDVILNILSPSNYGEFKRIINNGGILIKVVPGNDYLRELRKVFYKETEKETYSSNRVMEHFRNNFNLTDIQSVRYSVELSKDELGHLIKMTPLSWGATEDKVQKVLNEGIDCITADFNIMTGRG